MSHLGFVLYILYVRSLFNFNWQKLLKYPYILNAAPFFVGKPGICGIGPMSANRF